jgi:hypothetical protein
VLSGVRIEAIEGTRWVKAIFDDVTPEITFHQAGREPTRARRISPHSFPLWLADSALYIGCT